MKHIQKYTKFNESVISSVKEIEFDESYMYKCMMILNLIPREGKYEDQLNALGLAIKHSLNEETYNKLFDGYLDLLTDTSRIFNFFVTSVVNKDDLIRMFSKVIIQEGSDLEDEWVATLSINDTVVLLLASPERGSSIRIEGRHHLPMTKLIGILSELCKFYNENF